MYVEQLLRMWITPMLGSEKFRSEYFDRYIVFSMVPSNEVMKYFNNMCKGGRTFYIEKKNLGRNDSIWSTQPFTRHNGCCVDWNTVHTSSSFVLLPTGWISACSIPVRFIFWTAPSKESRVQYIQKKRNQKQSTNIVCPDFNLPCVLARTGLRLYSKQSRCTRYTVKPQLFRWIFLALVGLGCIDYMFIVWGNVEEKSLGAQLATPTAFLQV